MIKNKISFFSSAEDIVFIWYPELRQMDQYQYKEDSYNILLLGGSVLVQGWGSVPKYIKESGPVLGKRINLLNLATSAHSSLDSFYKYKWIRDKGFDIVLLYHGINEVRANNMPAELWDKDYSHYSWYDEVNFYFHHPVLRKTGFLFPYFFKHIAVQLNKNIINKEKYAPTQSLRKNWLDYGKNIKTRESFRANLLKIIDIAQGKKETLIIPTFAYFYPKHYPLGPNGQQYYVIGPNISKPGGPDIRNISLWGKPENVVLGINVHNVIIKNLAKKKNFVFLDMAKLMSGENLYFQDVCHFTGKGSKYFVEKIFNQVTLPNRKTFLKTGSAN